MPTALTTAARPADETSESANSTSITEDGNPPAPAPERPWSPSVPVALSTQASRRYNIRDRRAEQPENANSASETQPSLRIEAPPPRNSPAPSPQTLPSPAKIRPPTKPKSNSIVHGGFGSDVVPSSSSFSDEENKVSC